MNRGNVLKTGAVATAAATVLGPKAFATVLAPTPLATGFGPEPLAAANATYTRSIHFVYGIGGRAILSNPLPLSTGNDFPGNPP